MGKGELEMLAPEFRWSQYFTDSGAPAFQSLNVAWPDFFRVVNSTISGASLDDWRTYLIWHVLHSQAPLLPTAFVEENFNFFGKTLTGAQELRPRWKRCVDFTDNQLGEALGRKFVERTFGAEGKQRTLKMVDALEKAMSQNIQQVTWMTPATKQHALAKLKAITNKIGYPNKWRDYSSVLIKRDDAAGNGMRADQFEFLRQLNKIGKPVDREEWGMTPPTVNAYYDPLLNNINFPAGILQPPFFDNHSEDAANFGAIGVVIGHELTHGFDDEGRQFDAKGNLRDWWTPADAKAFEERSACIAKQYSNFSPVPGVYLNGKLTLGENTADNGGVRVASMALANTIGNADQKKVEGFTTPQRFFLAFAQVWCENQREEALRLRVQTDPHSPGRFRVNGVVQNMPDRRIADIPARVATELARSGMAARLSPGAEVAIGVGSRGIHNLELIVGSVVRHWKDQGLRPLLFPAMGSHGGATAEGQQSVLAHYGITEASMDCPIVSQLEVVSLGKTADGIEAFMDRAAYQAGAVLLVNRVKWHTDFSGAIESGLFKMMAIGLGKLAGAQRYHSYGHRLGLEYVIRTVGRQTLGSGKILGGVAILEDAYHNTAKIDVVPAEAMERREEENLALVKSWMATLPMDLDLLVVDEMGKNISGLGMDTKIINRTHRGEYNLFADTPRIERIFTRALSDLSYGNALGVG